MVFVKRIYDSAKDTDGFRVLVDRIWPRGISKQKARVDLWLRDIAPTDALRKRFAHDPAKWSEFRHRYFAELRANKEATAELHQLLKKNRRVTLLFSARDVQHNQAIALKAFLR